MNHTTKLISLLGLVAILAGMLASCTPTPGPVVTPPAVVVTVQPVEPALVVTDALGRNVTFDKLPGRVVVAGKATALLVNSLYLFPEAATRIAAIENRSQAPDAFIPLVDAGYTAKLVLEKNAGPEAIAPLQPDVVILKTSMKEKLGDPLEAIGIAVVYLDLETPEAFYRDIRTIGVLFGNSPRADEIVVFYQNRVSQVTEALKGLTAEQKVDVLLLQHSVEENVVSYGVPPANWLQTILVETAGGNPVWKGENVGNGWQTVTLDQIATWNPTLIGIIDYSGGAEGAVAAIEADSTWQQLEAVKEHHLLAFPMDYLSWDQPDPRWILGLQWAADVLHPDLFPGFDIQAEILGFYQSLYGLDEATVTATIFPLLRGTLTIE